MFFPCSGNDCHRVPTGGFEVLYIPLRDCTLYGSDIPISSSEPVNDMPANHAVLFRNLSQILAGGFGDRRRSIVH